MKNYYVLSLFPDMVLDGLNTSILKRAMEKQLISVNGLDIRDYTQEKHHSVDDYTYGGGAGMLMQAQPVVDCFEALVHKLGKKPRCIYVTPQGKQFTQKAARELAQEEELVFLCGHYEGIDERALELVATDYFSIGDYVLTGGELPAMVMIDAISRLIPGVLHNEESSYTESFDQAQLLEYPQYSRPEVYRGMPVPAVLLSGNHKEIDKWRQEQSLLRTRQRRPDLLEPDEDQRRFYDISRELFSAPAFPGDPLPSKETIFTMKKEPPDTYMLTRLSLGTHSGTHMDAPAHFYRDGRTIDQVELGRCMGRCKVVHMEGKVTGSMMRHALKDGTRRLLIAGDICLSASSAWEMRKAGLQLVGVEGLTVGPMDALREVHLILLEQETAILENLDLSQVPEGIYTLAAQPLKLGGLDGAPVRAVLMKDEKEE